jgi:hypothetical protein
MIAAALLTISLYLTAVLFARVRECFVKKQSADFTALSIATAVLWGAFYYFA